MATLRAAKKSFEDASTEVLGISIDSIFAHKVYDLTLGGLWFPLLADFHPKGAVADLYGIMTENGISKRACFLIDKQGVVQAAEVYESGLPNVPALAAKAAAL